MRDTQWAQSAHQRDLDLLKIIELRDREMTSIFNDRRRSNALTMLAQIRAAGLLTEDEFSRLSREARNAKSAGFANQLWCAAQQSYSLDPIMGTRKFGPHYVVLKTPLSNLRITTFFAGESEAKLIDPSRVSVAETVGCQVEFVKAMQ